MRFISFRSSYGSSLFSSGSLLRFVTVESQCTLAFMLVVCCFLFSFFFCIIILTARIPTTVAQTHENVKQRNFTKSKRYENVLPSFFTNCSSSSICEKSPAKEGRKKGENFVKAGGGWFWVEIFFVGRKFSTLIIALGSGFLFNLPSVLSSAMLIRSSLWKMGEKKEYSISKDDSEFFFVETRMRIFRRFSHEVCLSSV